MLNDIICEIRIGDNSLRAHESKFRLLKSSAILKFFSQPLEILFKGKTIIGEPPLNEDNVKVFVGHENKWQNSKNTMNCFRNMWPDILETITNIRDGYTSLFYISGDIRHDKMFNTVFPFIQLAIDYNNSNFHISEIRSAEPNPLSLDAKICFEYQYDKFKQFVGPEGFRYTLGVMYIMGLIVNKSSINQFININFTDKKTLENVLLDDNVLCWWLADRDLEAINIWHKEVLVEELLTSTIKMIENKHPNICVNVCD